MREAAILAAVLAVALAKPEGFYHQQYQYRQSSSSYKNNELQHKNEDEGFYSKHGDIEGRSEPKVNSFSQHVEYNNPNRHTPSTGPSASNVAFENWGSHSRPWAGSGGLTSSRGGFGDSSRLVSGGQGYGLSGHQSGSSRQYSYSSSYGESGVSGGSAPIGSLQTGTYGTTSNLGALSRRVEEELSEQLRRAVSQRESSYSSGYSVDTARAESDFQFLKEELKRNLTRELQDQLKSNYGIQGERGPYSYSIKASGNFAASPNYETRELSDLTRNLENTLTRQLEDSYRQHVSANLIQPRPAVVRPIGDVEMFSSRPIINNHGHQSSSKTESFYSSSSSSGGTTHHQPREPTVSPVVPLAHIISRVDNELHRLLDTEILHRIQPESGRKPYYDHILSSLTHDLKRNITYRIDEELHKNYGSQIQDGAYSFSSNRHPQVANYKVEELALKKQDLEERLLRRLDELMRHYSTYFTRTMDTFHSAGTSHHSTSGTTYVQPQVPISQLKRRLETELEDLVNREYERQKNQLLHEHGNQRNVPDFERVSYLIQNTLRTNLTEKINQEIPQTHTPHSYSQTPRYRPEEIDTLRREIEDHLTRKITDRVRQDRKEYQSMVYSSSSSSFTNEYPGKPASLYDRTPENHNQPGYTQRTPTYQYRPSNFDWDSPDDHRRVPDHGSTGYQTADTTGRKTAITYNYVHGANRPLVGSDNIPQSSSHTQHQTSNVGYESRSSVSHPYPKRIDGENTFEIELSATTNNTGDLSEISRQLQEDLRRQLHTALQVQQASWQSHSSSSSGNTQSFDFQRKFQELQEELKRNLTQSLHERLREKYGDRGYTLQVQTGGTYYPKATYNQAQLTELQRKLQDDLVRQLQEGLNQQQTYYTQYSSRSSSSSHQVPTYGGTVSSAYGHGSQSHDRYYAPSSSSLKSGGFSSYSSYGSTQGEDCEEMQGDDPSAGGYGQQQKPVLSS